MKKIYITFIALICSIVLLFVYNFNYVSTIKNKEENHSVKKIIGTIEDELPWFPLTVSDNGIIYGQSGRKDDGKCSVISYNTKSNNIEIIDSGEDELSPMNIKENVNYVVWIEGVSIYDRRESRIKLYDKKDKIVKTIYESKEYLSLDSSPLALGENYVLWIDYKIEDDIMYPTIKKYNINTGEESIYRENAMSPVICDDFIAFITADATDENIGAVWIEDLSSNTVKQITSGTRVHHIGGKGDTLAISYVDISKKNCLALYENGKLNTIKDNSDYAYEYPTVSEKYISWQMVDGNGVYDRVKKQDITLEEGIKFTYFTVSDYYIIATSWVDGIEKKVYGEKYGMILSNIYIYN